MIRNIFWSTMSARSFYPLYRIYLKIVTWGGNPQICSQKKVGKLFIALSQADN